MKSRNFSTASNLARFWLKKFISFLILFLSVPSLTFAAHSGVEEEAIQEVKKEAVLILYSNIHTETDFISWQEDLREQQRNPKKVTSRSLSFSPSLADSIFSSESIDAHIQQAKRNIAITKDQINCLERMRTPDHIILWLTSFVKDHQLMVQEERERVNEQASFIPGMPLYNQIGAERANNLNSNYFSLFKLFMPFVRRDKIEHVFEPCLKDPSSIYAGYFLHLQAYLVDLTPSSPPVHSWLYRHAHQQFEEEAPSPINTAHRLNLKLKKQKLQQLLEGPLKHIGEQEKEIEGLWFAYKEGKLLPGQWRKSGVRAQEQKQPDTQKAPKKRHKKKPLQKGGTQDKETAPLSLQTMSQNLQEGEEQPVVTIDVSDTASATPELSQPLSLPDLSEKTHSTATEENPLEQKSTLLNLQPTLSASSDSLLDLSASSREDGSPEHLSSTSNAEQEPDERGYRYEPFVTLPQEDSLVAAPASAITFPTLKPKVHALWEEFWSTRWMEWDAFQTFFVNGLEFGFEPLGGSIRKFWYPRGSHQFFIAHEPHGGRTTVGPATLHDIRDRLTEDLGWTIHSFKSK